eukprot:TRINITY_DN81935_c0_g1_i1.p1 TRINITY_DN81935_c0_g1~~TRINITY_DN81935_c0_g1_i1.p1  ORF type:complete len:355 (+),score=47.11 TRINITY_DN81935_c0_g1_i1:28-1065(+)
MAISFNGLLEAEASLATQGVLLIFWAAVWYLLINWSSKHVFEPWVSSRPWKDRWTGLNKKTFEKSFFIDFRTNEEAFEFACLFLAIICQHTLGGALCIPSVLGYRSTWTSALACHGGLCEAGWELQDIVTRIYQVAFGGEAGRAKNPRGLLVMVGLHHAMGMGMVLPMNIKYHDNAYYHELILLLQLAACVALTSQNYGYTLDVKTSSGLRSMKLCVSLTFVSILYSRVIRYVFVAYHLIWTFYSDSETAMLCAGALVTGLMGVLNVMFFADSTQKLIKFMKMHTADEEIEEAATELYGAIQRHSSSELFILTDSERRWAKVRGAVLLGAFSKKAKFAAEDRKTK